MNYKNLLRKLSFEEDLKLFYDLIVPGWIRILIIAIIIYGLEYLFIRKLILFSEKKLILELFYQIVDSAQTISLVMFGSIVTGYSLFQAILKTNTLKLLAIPMANERSKLLEFNKYFYFLGITLVFFIGVNYFFLLLISNIDNLTNFNTFFNNISRSLVLLVFRIYLFIFLVILLDMKSFLKNIYENFMVNAYLDITEEQT